MKTIIERLDRAALLAVAFILCATSALAAVVTTTGGVGDTVTVNNSTANAGNFWIYGVSSLSIRIPAVSGLPVGSVVEVNRITMAQGGDNTAYTASSLTIKTGAGSVQSAAVDTTQSATGFCGITDSRKKAIYEFSEGSRPKLMVGMGYVVLLNGISNLRTTVTSKNGDSDLIVEVNAKGASYEYQPLMQIEGTIVSLPSSTSSLSASIVGSKNWSALSFLNGAVSESWANGDSATLTLSDSANLTVDDNVYLSSVAISGETGNIVVNGALKAGTATISTPLTVAESADLGSVTLSGNGSLTVDATSGFIAPYGLRNMLQNGLPDQEIRILGDSGKGISIFWVKDSLFTTHLVFDGGDHSVQSINSSSNYTVCNNSSNDDPLWLVKNGTTLNIRAKDFAGWSGSSKANTCVVAAENGATITLKDNESNTFYASNRWLLYPGSLLSVATESDRFRVIGGSSAGQEQFYVPAGSGEAVIGGTGTINLHAAVGIFVGEGSTLKVGNEIKQSSDIVKRGSGTWKQTGSMSTYTGSITIEAGTLALLNNRSLNSSTSLKFSAGTTLAIEEIANDVTSDGVVTFKVTSDSAVPNVVVYKAGTTTPIPGATASKDGTTLTITYTPASVSGSFCWMDFEFNDTTESSGQLSGSLKSWGKTNYTSYYYNNSQLYMDCRSASDNMTAFTFPAEWTAVMRTTAPEHSNDKPMTMLMCGNTSNSSYPDAVGIVATKEGKVALAIGTGIVGEPVSVEDATTKMHYYVIKRVSGNIKLYVDGSLKVNSDTTIAPAGVFQIGAVPGADTSVYSECDVAARVDYLRFYNCALGDNMLAAIRASIPWTSVTLDNVVGSDWSALSWSEDFNPDSNVQINVTSASSIEVGDATTVGILKLVGSADLTIADIGNLTVTEFDLSDYTGNLTLSVDNAATATTWKFTGSANVTITGISNLTLGAFDLSGYTGDLTVDGRLPAPIALNGGNLKFNIASGGSGMSTATSADAYQGCAITGTGNVYKLGTGVLFLGRVDSSDSSQLSNTYSGSTYIASGIVRRWYNAFGSNNNVVYVQSGGAVDLLDTGYDSYTYTYHLSGSGSGEYPAMFMSQGVSGNGGHSVKEIILDADANIGGNTGIRIGTYSWGYNEIYLNGHKLTKTGTGTFAGDAYKFIGEGTFEVQSGKYAAMGQHFSGSNAKLIVNENAMVSMYPWGNSANQTWKEVINNNRVYYEGNRGSNTFVVSGTYSGKGSIEYLTIANGVTLKPTSATTGMSVSGALTLEGTINVDLSEVDLTGKSKLAIITSPLQINKDTQVATFTLGSNSEDWVLYSEEVSTGVYELGVKLNKTIESSLSWSGSSGTWSANGFNAVEDSFYNDANQTVVFADDAGSSSDPLAVAVSGDKTVNALNFTADNRNVTLSGDAISATTVSKSGDGVAIVNNALSGITSISVTDGVLVLNPNGEAVSDVDSLDDGSLVIYVGAGVTRTVAESISATKIVKRGSGTLKVTAASTSVPLAIDEGVVAADSAPTSAVVVNEGGVFELISTSNVNDSSYGTNPTSLDLSKVTGGGTLKYSSTAGWRAFPDVDARMPASTLTLQTELADSLIITKNNGETVVGSLVGSKNIRSDFGSNGGNGRILTVTQSKDTEWQGKFVANRITKFNVVAPSEGTPGTLTLSGTQELSSYDEKTIPMQVDGSVNLTGTWVGNTTVAGTFGGTGTLDGALTFSAGSTFKAFASDENGLSVSGTVSYPESGTVTVDVDALGSPESDVVLISKSGLDETKFALKSGTPAGYALVVEDDALKLKVLVSITVPAIANTTVAVTVGGETIGTAAGSHYVIPGSEVTITYAAASGYELSGIATYTIASATDGATITITDTVSKPYVAQNGSAKFTTLAAAIANVATTSDPMVTLLANISEPEVTVSSTVMIMGGYTINADIKIADGGLLQSMATLNGKLTIEDGGAYATTGGTLSELVTKDGATIDLGMLSETTAPLSVTTLSVEGALTVRSSYGAGTFGTTYKAISYVTANATIAQDAEFVGIDQWESSVASEGANTIVSLTFTKIAVVGGVYYADAQDAVDAAVASGQPVSFLGAPGTVKIGIGDTLIVSAGTPIVALEDGLMNPPYDIAQTMDESYRNIYTVERYVAKLRNPNVGTTTYADEVKYTSLAAAVDDVVEQTMAIYADYVATVTLLDDITLDATVTVGKKMKLDLNGKTLTASGINAINNSTKLAVQGSSGSIAVTSGNSVVLTDPAATLTVSGGATLSPAPTTNVEGKYVKYTAGTYSLDALIINGVVEVGYMDGTTAVVTNATGSVTIPASGVTAVKIAVTDASNAANVTSAGLGLTSGSVTVYATNADGVIELAKNITGAFTVTAGESNTYTIALDGDKTVDGVNVKPETAETSPMVVAAGGAPAFKIKTIPGLWYAAEVSDSPSSGFAVVSGTITQAGGATTTLPGATAPTTGAKYYRIAVGASKAALTAPAAEP